MKKNSNSDNVFVQEVLNLTSEQNVQAEYKVIKCLIVIDGKQTY